MRSIEQNNIIDIFKGHLLLHCVFECIAKWIFYKSVGKFKGC